MDLGCGKGAVSVNIAKQLHSECYGIDAIEEFITYSKSKAKEYEVKSLCKFEVGDIREKIRTHRKYDVIILGAIGQVFGNYYETLTLLKNHLYEDGVIIIDDGYIENESNFSHAHVLIKSDLRKQIADAGMQIIDEIIANEDTSINYDTEFENIIKRCNELTFKYPDKVEIFINFCKQQKKEYYNLKNEITCSTMVVKRKY